MNQYQTILHHVEADTPIETHEDHSDFIGFVPAVHLDPDTLTAI